MKRILLLISILIFSYGAVVGQSFTSTSVDNITQTSVRLKASVDLTSGSGNYYIKYLYQLQSDPPFSWNDAGWSGALASGSTYNDTKNLSGLTAGTGYNYKAELYDGSGSLVTTSSPTVAFTTSSATAPTGMVTGTIENVDHNSAEINTNTVGDDGGDDITSYGIKYGTSDPPTSTKEMGNTGFSSYPANFNASVSGLDASTKYYVRSYATNSTGTSEGSSKSFYTEPSSSGSVSISGLTDTDHTKLTLDMSGGDGTGKIVVGYLSGASTTIPSDGKTYSGNTSYGSGDALGSGTVLYVGTGASVNITNLDGDNNDYDFYVYHYAGSGSDINYLQINPASAQTNTTEFPIDLLSFTAENADNAVIINWATASEFDNDLFEIERSTDAENFEVIASVPGAGYSNELINYSIKDADLLEGTVYYRLKQTDYNGAFTYSYILPVTIGETNDIQISNIISKETSISFVYNNNNGGKTQMQLLDASGRIIKSQEVNGDGSQLIRMNMRGRSHGIYILHITLDNQTITKKVVF
jgi:hypothetical protein